MESGKLTEVIQEWLQQEWKSYEESGRLDTVRLCCKVSGGPLDYPKAVPKSVADIVAKWDSHFDSLFLERARKGNSADVSAQVSVEEAGSRASSELQTRSKSSRAGIANEADLVTTVDQSACKMEEHLSAVTRDAIEKGRLSILTQILGGVVLVRNTLWGYEDFCKESSQESLFRPAYKLFCGFADSLAEQLLEAQNSRIATCILSSSECQDWSNPKPFYEGERGSFAVQMWWHHIQGLKQDMWRTLPPKIAQRILAAIVNDSLSILTSRYTRAYPSEARLAQYVNDLVNLLWCISDLLISCSSSMDHFLRRGSLGKVLMAIHAKCDLLFCFLALVGCPLSILYKSFKKGLVESLPMQKPESPVAYPPWLPILKPEYFLPLPYRLPQNNLGSLPPEVEIYLDVLLLAAQPEPLWPLVIKILFTRKALVATSILSTLVEKQCPDSMQCTSSTSSLCRKFLCATEGGICTVRESCLCHLICSAVMYVIVHTQKRKEVLTAVIQPVLSRISDWSILDRTQVWNWRRPSWYLSLVSLVEPYLEAGILGLVSEEEWSEDRETDVTRAVSSLLTSLCHTVPLFPPLLLRLILSLEEDMAPPDVKPLGGSVGVHLVASSLHSLLNHSGRVGEMVGADLGEGDKDLLVAVGERLCHLDGGEFKEKVDELAEKLRESAQDDNWEELHFEDLSSDPESLVVAEIFADSLLSERRGKQSLQLLYWFLTSNLPWLRTTLGLVTQHQKRALTKAHTRLHLHVEQAELPTLQAFQWIGERHFDEVLAGTFSIDWSAILQNKLGLSKEFVHHVIQHRWELQKDAELGQNDQEMLQSLMGVLGDGSKV